MLLIDEGQYEATVLTVEEEPNQWFKEGEDPESKKVRWVWTLKVEDGNDSTVRFFTGTTIGNKKANLTKIAAAVLGKTVSKLTDEDKTNFDTDKAIGKKILIDIIHQESEDGSLTYNKVDRVAPILKKAKGKKASSSKQDNVSEEDIPF
jgi:hypothetical protein